MYRLSRGSAAVRLADGAVVPDDSSNRDWKAYQAWLSLGNEPEPESLTPEEEMKGVAGYMQLYRHTNTGDNSEIRTELPIGGDTQLCYREIISDVRKGEVIVVLAEIEFSNSNPHNVGVWSQAKMGASSSDRGGLEISESNGRNISPNMHHDTHVIVGTIVADADYSSRSINIWARAAANAGGSAVQIEQDYGRLSVLRFR